MSEAERRKLYETHIGEVVTSVSLDPAWRDTLSVAPDGLRYAVDPGSLFRAGVRWALQEHGLRFVAFKDSDPELGECFCVESAEFPDIRMCSVVVDGIEGLADVSAAEGEGNGFGGRLTEVEATHIATRFLRSNGHAVVSADYRGVIDRGKPPLCCCRRAWDEGHWSVLFTPSFPGGGTAQAMPL